MQAKRMDDQIVLAGLKIQDLCLIHDSGAETVPDVRKWGNDSNVIKPARNLGQTIFDIGARGPMQKQRLIAGPTTVVVKRDPIGQGWAGRCHERRDVRGDTEMQAALTLLYPHQCIACATMVADRDALCGACWATTRFVSGLVCDACGAPLPGEDTAEVLCDDCINMARPWDTGRTALIYADTGRKLVLALKHGDRTELARAGARWMRRAAADILSPDAVIVPIPVHWLRLLKRRYNQAALLAQTLSHACGATYLPDALIRTRQTKVQDGMSVPARFANMQDAIRPHPRRGAQLAGKKVVLIDDVMTSGATLAAATEACRAANAASVSVLTLARVVKDA